MYGVREHRILHASEGDRISILASCYGGFHIFRSTQNIISSHPLSSSVPPTPSVLLPPSLIFSHRFSFTSSGKKILRVENQDERFKLTCAFWIVRVLLLVSLVFSLSRCCRCRGCICCGCCGCGGCGGCGGGCGGHGCVGLPGLQNGTGVPPECGSWSHAVVQSVFVVQLAPCHAHTYCQVEQSYWSSLNAAHLALYVGSLAAQMPGTPIAP